MIAVPTYPHDEHTVGVDRETGTHHCDTCGIDLPHEAVLEEGGRRCTLDGDLPEEHLDPGAFEVGRQVEREAILRHLRKIRSAYLGLERAINDIEARG